MLSQEELDQLLEKEGNQESPGGETPEEEEKAGLSAEQDAQGEGQAEGQDDGGEEAQAADSGSDASEDDISWEDAFKEAASGGDAAAAKAMQENQGDLNTSPETPETEPADFQNFQKESPQGTARQGSDNLEFILDLPLEISVELGRSRMQIRDLLQLGQGSIVELNKMAGEPAEIYVNNKLLAKGEVVVVNEKFGIRLSEIISPADRVKTLG